jgi:SAM-dependent methyltransferase
MNPKSFARLVMGILKQPLSWFRLRFPSSALRLHIGCGQNHMEGFLNIDCNHSRATDYVCDAGKLPCPNGSVERIETYHVIEHIPRPVVHQVLSEWCRVLKTGGRLVIECPDFDNDVREYLEGNTERLFSIFGRQRFHGDAHLWGYTATSLKELVESVGLTNCEIKPAQDYHAQKEPCLRLECLKR